MKRIFRSSGFTLVEVMIVAAVLGGLALVVSQMTKTLTQSTTKASFDTDMLMTTNEIASLLTSPAKCLATFGSTSTPVSISNTPNGNKFYIKGQPLAPANGYGNVGLDIVSYTLAITGNDGVLTILYQNKNILKGNSGPSTKAKVINLYVEGTPGAVTNCRTQSSASSDIWSRGSGAYSNDIYYLQGNVGVGTASPTSLFDVSGGTLGTVSGNQIELAHFRNSNANANILRIYQNRFTNGTSWFSADTRIQQRTDVTDQAYISFSPDGNGGLALGAGSPSSEKVRVLGTNGYVGIGTTNPTYHLHVESNNANYTGITNSNTSAGGVRWTWLSGGVSAPLGAGKMCFETGNFCRLSLTQAGDLTANSVGTGVVTATGNITTTANMSSVNSTASGTMSAASFTYTSDRRLKENIESIQDSVEKIMGLRPVKFRWIKDKRDDYGFIAQEVNKVIPEITSTDDKKIMRVDYAKIVPFLVDTIQKQQKQIEQQQKRIEALEKKIK